MKLVVVILFTCLMQVSASTLAQRISLSEKNASLEQVLKKIKLQTGFDVLYGSEVLNQAKKVNINLSNIPVDEALGQLFEGQPLNYQVKDKTIFITRKEPSFLDRLAERWADRDVRGRVVDESGKPLPSASIRVKGKDAVINTNDKGEFVLKGVADDAVLIISYVGYKQLEIPVKGASMPLEIKLNQLTGQLEEVAVKGNTGYQVIDKNHPGSFTVLDNKLLSRSTDPNILKRMDYLVTGLSSGIGSSSAGDQGADNPIGIIRGRNSINASVAPLIVLDNFPYEGDISNINPDDVESITVLKDAAASALWGARAGNGVIVITTKRGKTSTPSVSVTSNFTTQAKPDLHKLPVLSSAEEIEFETWAFNKGYYNSALTSLQRPPLTPVLEILFKRRNGQLTQEQADELIRPMKSIDVRDDLEQYFYQRTLSQQHSMHVSGNSPFVNYYMSAGYNAASEQLVGNSSNRINLSTRNTFRVLPFIDINLGINYVQSNGNGGGNLGSTINPGGGKALYPYADLVDDNGKALTLVKDMRSSYLEGLNNGKILDWTYRPYDEINSSTLTSKNTALLANADLIFKVNKQVNLSFLYQFQNQNTGNEKIQTIDSYYTRNLINSFYQPASNQFPIPKGGIREFASQEMRSHYGRVQMDFTHSWGQHTLNVIGGWEISEKKNINNGQYRLYGYSREGSLGNYSLDFINSFVQYPKPFLRGPIPLGASPTGETLDRFISSYASLLYSFKDRYIVSASARQNAANLFGVSTNHRGVPLWSVGLTWDIGKEEFYHVNWFPLLRLRTSYGYTGNIAKVVPGIATFQTNSFPNDWGATFATVLNPPNSKLRWEQNGTFNIGLDFATKSQRFSGTIEYYRKYNKDLLANAPFDPTSGLGGPYGSQATIYANVASIKGKGVELTLNSININGKFQWGSNFKFSYARTIVSEYFLPPPITAQEYVSGAQLTPIVGKEMYTYYRYRWAGLDPTDGSPRGYLGNAISKDYQKIYDNTAIDSLVFLGPGRSPYFGSLFNNLMWKNWTLSVGMNYVFGGYFTRPSYYGSFLNWTYHSDASKRWQQPGDEKNTDVPARTDSALPGGALYQFSEVLAGKMDHVRLNDIRLGYAMRKQKFLFKQIDLYCYASNLNILLWKSDKKITDPAYSGGNINAKQVSLGASLKF